MENYELRHWGVKGMKWGVRRYQNKDGSLTDAGERRYARDAREKGYEQYDERSGYRYKFDKDKGGKIKGKEALDVDAGRYVQEDRQRLKRVTDESTQMAGKLKGMTDASIRNTKANRQKMDLSQMSEKQMRDEINRALLERQYNDMFAPQKSTKGREHISRILEIGGAALGVTSSALGIALAIKELKG